MLGAFVISLDFELLWGVLDHADENTYGSNVLGARAAIPKILNLFQEYGVHATWGIVGFLYNENKDELIATIPKLEPSYRNLKLSPYNHMENISTENRKYYFAPELIQQIRESENQEIASHTYSHYYCCEAGQTIEQFRVDIENAVKIAQKNGDSINSIIFPRNQYNPKYDEILKLYNIKSYRGNEKSWCYKSDADRRGIKRWLVRAGRLLDSYINICGSHCYSYEELEANGTLNIKSSRFLRPYSKKFKFLEKLKLRRIKKQMSYAAKKGQIFHMWWHPHNFGINLIENLSNLRELLEHYKLLNQTYQFTSMNMREVTQFYENRNFGKQR